jgi:hypothetical protein
VTIVVSDHRESRIFIGFHVVFELGNLVLCVKMTMKFDRMNYGCPEVEITSKALRIRATKSS